MYIDISSTRVGGVPLKVGKAGVFKRVAQFKSKSGVMAGSCPCVRGNIGRWPAIVKSTGAYFGFSAEAECAQANSQCP